MGSFEIVVGGGRTYLMSLEDVACVAVNTAVWQSPVEIMALAKEAEAEACTPDGQARYDAVIRTIDTFSKIGVVSREVAEEVIYT